MNKDMQQWIEGNVLYTRDPNDPNVVWCTCIPTYKDRVIRFISMHGAEIILWTYGVAAAFFVLLKICLIWGWLKAD